MTLSIHTLRIIAAAISISLVGLAPAFAIDGSHDDPAKPTHPCKPGYVYSEKTKGCVKVTSGLLDSKELFAEGRALAKAGYYNQALAVLAAADQNDSMVLTMIGYSKRKLGQWDDGVAYYRQALVINPNNANTREYLGEAWLTKGRTDLAQAELVKIAAITGTGSEQYEDLAKAIAGEPAL
jgi:tetratricopeptide (TPR) repeat protein